MFLLLNLACSTKGEVDSQASHFVSNVSATNLHSAFEDPDISVEQGRDFAEIRSFMGQPLLDTTVAALETAPAMPKHLEIAESFADDPTTEVLEGGVVENPSNRSPEIDGWLSALGVPLGLPYCAAFVSFCLTESEDVKLPETRSAGARQFIQNDSFHADMCAQSLAMASPKCNVEVPARVVQRGTAPILPGSLAIWKRNRDPQDWKGHIGMVREWSGQKGKTVEANTSSGVVGNQADGGGVYLRERDLKIGSWFRITHFTSVVLN